MRAIKRSETEQQISNEKTLNIRTNIYASFDLFYMLYCANLIVVDSRQPRVPSRESSSCSRTCWNISFKMDIYAALVRAARTRRSSPLLCQAVTH